MFMLTLRIRGDDNAYALEYLLSQKKTQKIQKAKKGVKMIEEAPVFVEDVVGEEGDVDMDGEWHGPADDSE